MVMEIGDGKKISKRAEDRWISLGDNLSLLQHEYQTFIFYHQNVIELEASFLL